MRFHMASRFERFITSHLGTTEHFYGSRMGGDGERHRVGLIIRRIFGSEILRAYFWTGGVGGGCVLLWSTSFKMAEILMFVCLLLQFEFVKPRQEHFLLTENITATSKNLTLQ